MRVTVTLRPVDVGLVLALYGRLDSAHGVTVCHPVPQARVRQLAAALRYQRHARLRSVDPFAADLHIRLTLPSLA